VLEGLGWKLHRIWSTDWFRNPDRETDRALAAIEDAIENLDAEVSQAEPLKSFEAQPNANPTEALATVVHPALSRAAPANELSEPYREVQLRIPMRRDLLSLGNYDLETLVRAVVEQEGPVHTDEIARRIREGFGLERTGRRILDLITATLGRMKNDGRIVREDDFWRSITLQLAKPRSRRGAALALRRADRIAPEEYRIAIETTLHASVAASRAELKVSVARTFGFDRTGNDLDHAIAVEIDRMIDSGQLEDVGDRLRLAMLYRGMDQAALDAAYNNGAAAGIERRDRIMADWTARTAALAGRVRARRDLRYGPAARNSVDFYPSGNAAGRVLVFIHGGYWQFSDKENYGCVAEGPLAHGIDVAMLEYTLAPAIRMDGIVAEVRAALAWLRRELAPRGFVVSGHSAGGHLAAMMLGEPGVVGCLPISGLFDLEPIRLSYLNDKVLLDEADARRNSPIHHVPAHLPPLSVAVGGAELPEMQRQSVEYAAACGSAALTLPGHDHFSILEELARPDGRLTDSAKGLFT
jgi:acetyl esterase/lipase